MLKTRLYLIAVAGSLAIGCAQDPSDDGTANEFGAGAFTLLVSSSPSRSAPVALAGATAPDRAYVFTSDGTRSATPAGIRQVSYWLDDTAMTGAARQVEHFAAYDFAGTAGDASALPFDTTRLAAGMHIITQAVLPVSGAAIVFSAAFQVGKVAVDGGAPPPPSTDGGGVKPPPAACPQGATELQSFGAVGGGGDDTSVFAKALASTASAGHVLHVPAGTYHVGPLSVPSNANLCFEAGATVEARASWGPFEVMWSIDGASNVTLEGYGATFHMAKSIWQSDPDPEYRHCVSVTGGASNVHLAGFKCVTFGGDGLYLAGNSTAVLAEDITADGCARDGLTVISAHASTVRRCHFINGHTGVDMEPNVATDALDGVHLEDSETVNNGYGGVNVSTYAYTASSKPLDVTVLRHHDVSSGVGATDWHGGTSFSANGTNGVALGGSLVFDSCVSDGAGSRAAWVAWWTADGPSVTFTNLTVHDPNRNHSAIDAAAIAVGRGGGGEGAQGNSTFTGTTISDTKGNLDYYFTYYDGSGQPFTKVKFVNSGALTGAKKAPPNGLLDGAGVSSVNQ